MHLRVHRSARGFTLIELMVVLAVIAAAAAMAVPAMNSITGANAKKAAGDLAGTTRVLFDAAALRHATCRLAIDLDKRAFWAECAPGPAGVSLGAEKQDEEELARQFPEEMDPELRKVLAGSKFGEFKDRLVERRELPGKAKFGALHLEGRRDPQEAGIAYVYFFPGGQAQKAWVPIVDGKFLFTVVTEPFTGRSKVLAGKPKNEEGFQ